MAPLSRKKDLCNKFLDSELRRAARRYGISVTDRLKDEVALALSRAHISDAQIRRANSTYAVVERSGRAAIMPYRPNSHRAHFSGGQHTLTFGGNGDVYASTYARIGPNHRRLIRDEFDSYDAAFNAVQSETARVHGTWRHFPVIFSRVEGLSRVHVERNWGG
ncbi:uncharacterized protein SPPG_02426 [Spizellomyces punctatus DAOM BR117]|uniref:Uncharacterized protein n=1 Tax=Spizellomyces punctatus (strain DAOM BR117) TaxID=645134 RepID=A0A0L0HLB3_SPIPD|nr:uncharacterized protein SPPG_02426 [Spizellomyces punctatus DAOM BR117]KND01917.1 hypothetical protein SPPG_02426 [Spizellomyces punctatus DAOM BR117]|eukprot:XP_016609956.1 hypothetical protein SPPG_02426 [Spizellomyces punctatus DAOM BR117]